MKISNILRNIKQSKPKIKQKSIPIVEEIDLLYKRKIAFPRKNDSILASFYRGGTSRGILINSKELSRFDKDQRDLILCNSMGSPDLDGRQIDGLGGGSSSLSKVAILSKPKSKFDQICLKSGHPFPSGKDWINSHQQRVSKICDIIYRFGQVSIKERSIDWGSTCGNMVSAAALFAIRNGMIDMERFGLPLAGSTYNSEKNVEEYAKYAQEDPSIAVRVLAHDTGKVIKVHSRIKLVRDMYRKLHWLPVEEGNVSISGVPGKSAGLVIENPLDKDIPPLSTGNERDIVEVDGEKIEISIIDVGLPVVFVKAESLNFPISALLEHPEKIDSNRELMDKLERIRKAACDLTPSLKSIFSPPSPKICVIHPAIDYTSTSGKLIKADTMDLFVRIVSTGQLHRTIPATTLSALAIGRCYKNSIISEVYDKQGLKEDKLSEEGQMLKDQCIEIAKINTDRLKIFAVGQPAGVSTASAMLSDQKQEPEAIIMLRTARHIISGNISIPPSIQYNRELYHKIGKMMEEEAKKK